MFQKLGHLDFKFVSDFDIRISDFWGDLFDSDDAGVGDWQ
jgi:hypothetical protein